MKNSDNAMSLLAGEKGNVGELTVLLWKLSQSTKDADANAQANLIRLLAETAPGAMSGTCPATSSLGVQRGQ